MYLKLIGQRSAYQLCLLVMCSNSAPRPNPFLRQVSIWVNCWWRSFEFNKGPYAPFGYINVDPAVYTITTSTGWPSPAQRENFSARKEASRPTCIGHCGSVRLWMYSDLFRQFRDPFLRRRAPFDSRVKILVNTLTRQHIFRVSSLSRSIHHQGENFT